MKCDFFTLGGYFLWEDIYNYQDWVIQRNLMSQRCRLLDSHNIRRHTGSFEQCKEKLLEYIEAYELDDLYDDTIIILHGFARTKKSVRVLAESLKSLKMNVITIGYPSLRRGITYHAMMLSYFLNNINVKGKLYVINVGASCLITRKLLSKSNNYRHYKIARILDINPLNSGSDLAELLAKSSILNFLFGPMLVDIATPNAIKMPLLPYELEHGIIFSPLTIHDIAKKMLAKFDSFPFSTPPSEESYAKFIKKIDISHLYPLACEELQKASKEYILTGKFSFLNSTTETGDNDAKTSKSKKITKI